MKKERIFIKLFGSSLAAIALTALAGAGACSAAPDTTDMAGMMAEGIPYECAEAKKCVAGTNDNRADLEALMAEGIVYADSVVADDKVLIKLDHREALLQSMEACLCEGPYASVVMR
jgi:hypothetical protein